MIDAFQNINENITLVRGDTLAFGVELIDVAEDGTETALTQDLDNARFSVRKDYENTELAFQKTLGSGIEKVAAGKYRVRIAPDDTAGLDPGDYYYALDIGLNNDNFTILRGLFRIEHDA